MLIDFHILPPTTKNQAGGVVAVMRNSSTGEDLADFPCYHGGYFCGEGWQISFSGL